MIDWQHGEIMVKTRYFGAEDVGLCRVQLMFGRSVEVWALDKCQKHSMDWIGRYANDVSQLGVRRDETPGC